MEEVQSPTANISGPPPMPLTANWKLGENLALSHLSALPELPQTNAEDYKLQELQYAMHLGSSMLNYTPDPGLLKGGDPHQAANRFDDSRVVKRKIFVNKEVLGRLVSVAEELNKAQAQIEIRKMLKREHRRMRAEQQQQQPGQSAEADSDMVAHLLAGLEAGGQAEEETAGPSYPGAVGKRAAARMAKRAPAAYRMAQVHCPAVLASMAPKDRWGYFRAMQRLMPAANGGRPGHIAFGSTAPQLASERLRPRVGSTAAVKAAKQLEREVERQAEAAEANMTECGEDDGQGSAATGAGGFGGAASGGGGALAELDATVHAVIHANQVREARRAAARQLAEDEGLPTETWWDIMQKRKKLVYFKKLLDEMAGRMDLIKLHRAARVIQKAWRAHRRSRTRNASEEIALLQKQLVHRKAMEVALRTAAEAAIIDQQERAKKRAARLAARIAAMNAMQQAAAQQLQAAQQQQQQQASLSGASDHGGKAGGNGTFCHATSSKNLGWQHSLRGSIHSSVSHSASVSASRAASARRLEVTADAGQEGSEDNAAYLMAQNNLWSKIQALIGTDWDVDGDEDDEDSEDDGEDEEYDYEDEDEDEDGGSEDEGARRLRQRQARNAARRARKAAEDAAAAAEGEKKKKKKKKKGWSPGGEGPLPRATMLVKVVKQALMAAKAMQDEDEKKGDGKRQRRKNHRGRGGGAANDPAMSMRMLTAAAAALNMTVEAYVAMRNRKMGVTSLQPWKPPPFPLLLEADGKPVTIDEDELREMEEEARRELLEKAAMEFVAAATAAAAPSSSTTVSGSVPGRTGSMVSAVASVAASGDTSSIMTWGSAAAVALAGGEVMLDSRSASEAAAAFAAAAAPSLTIPEDDVWALVKEKLRLRMAARAEAAIGGTSSRGRGGGATSTAGATATSFRGSFLDTDSTSGSDYEDREYGSDDDDDDSNEYDIDDTGQRHRRRSRRRGGAAATDSRRSGGRGGHKGHASRRHGGGPSSDSGYETMSEEEIRGAGRTTLLRIQHQKERSRQELQAYYMDRRRSKKAAAAAAAASLRAERVAARAARREAVARLRRGQDAGPAWRPGGGGVLRRGAAAAAGAGNAAAAAGEALPSQMQFWRPPPPRLPPRSLRGAAAGNPGGETSGVDEDGFITKAALEPPLIRLGPYNLSPGGPSLLYRNPKRRTRDERISDRKAGVRAATWLKGAHLPGAVFTQFGWVPARPHSTGHGLTLQLQSLADPDLLPALEAYVRQLGIPRKDLGPKSPKASLGSNGVQHKATHVLGGHFPPSHARMQPLMVNGLSGMSPSDGHRAGSPGAGATRPPPAPDSVAAILGAASTGFFVTHAPIMPHPPGIYPPSVVSRTSLPSAVSAPTRGAAPQPRNAATTAAGGRAPSSGGLVDCEDDTTAPDRSASLGPPIQLIPDSGGGDGLGISAVVGRAVGSPTASAAASSRSLLTRARFNVDVHERPGTSGGGFVGRSSIASRRSMSPVAEETQLSGSSRLMGSVMSLESRAVGSVGGSFRPGAASRGARSASTVSAAAAAAMGSTDANIDDRGPSSAEDVLTGSPQEPPQQQQPQDQEQQQEDGNGTALIGEPFQVAVAVLRSKSIKPGVAERVFPLGLAHINDLTSSVLPKLHDAEDVDVDMTGDGGGPMSYPLDDISSSNSSESDADADGWATASGVSDGEGNQTEPANAGPGADRQITGAEGGEAEGALGSSAVQPAESTAALTSVKPLALPGNAEHSRLRRLRQDPTAVRKVSRASAPSVTAGVLAGRSVYRAWQGRTQPPLLAIPGSAVCAAGDASTAAATDEGPLQDEDGERQFDLLYDMTRWAVARPSTPTDYRVEDDHIAITLRRSKGAYQRDAEEARARRRARVLAAYGGAAGASMYGGNAYERVLFRRRHARALAALAASQSPLAQLLRAVAFDQEIAGKSLMHQHVGTGTGTVTDTGAGGGAGIAARDVGGYSASATSREGFHRARQGAGGGRRRSPFIAGCAVHGNASSGIIWIPSSGGKVNMRVRPGGGCTSGFGNSYYWRQPVRLGSLINILPAGEARQSSATGNEGRAVGYRDANGTKATSRSMNGRLAAVPPPPPEVTEMTNTALKLLSDLGSEIGRMEEEIEALQRQAELEKQRQQDVGGRSGVGGAADPPIPGAVGPAFGSPSSPTPMPTPPSPSGSVYRTQYLTFHQQYHLQPQAQPAQQPNPQRPASRSRMTQPPVSRLTLMTLDPPTGIQGTPVPRLQYSQRPVSPSQLRAPQGRQAIATSNCSVGSSPNAAAATSGGAGNRRAAITGGSIPPLSVAAFRGTTGTVAWRGAVEQSGATGSGDVDATASGSNSPTDNTHSHSAPLLRLGQPPSPNGAALVSPNFQKVSSVGSGSGSSESALLDAIMPPGPPLGATPLPNAGGAAARRNIPNPALVPTPHNTLSGNGGWPSSCVSTLSGMAPTAADATSPPLPPPPIAAWASPRRSVTGGEIAVGVSVPWELHSPKAVAASASAASGVGSAAGVPSQVPPAHLSRIGVQPYPRNNSPPTLLPSIGIAAAVPPARPSPDGQAYSINEVSRLGSQALVLQGGSAAAMVAAGAAAGSAAVTKTSPPKRMSSAGHEVAAPSSPPLAAWGAMSSPTGVLPEISQPAASPKLNLAGHHTMRTQMSYSASGSLASSGAGTAAAIGMRASTPLMGATRAGPATSTSPPHSPLRNYPRMELGLGVGGSPHRIRRGSSNSPSSVYYQYSVGGTGGGGGQQVAISDGNESGTAVPGVTVESLLLNVALFGQRGRGGGSGVKGVGDRATAVLRASVMAVPPTRRPRASETSMPTPTLPAPLMASAALAGTVAATATDIPAGSSGRPGRARRLSIGPLPGETGSGGGSATAVMLS